MKLSEQWIREWANPAISSEELCKTLTMAGLEVESVTPVAEKFTNVVVGEILAAEKHPEADRLKVCQVNVGQAEPLTIVCGAANAAAGMKVAVALVGAVLPKMKITRSKLRGVASYGMLCSEVELTIAEESQGIMALPADAPIGKDVWDYLNLSDQILDINITPNRGDCLSVLGVSIETSALTNCTLNRPAINAIPAVIQDTLSVKVDAPAACPRYVGRIIRGVNNSAPSPIWLKERLRRSGIRSISPVVDVMNYVMLEIGQPMHAFDLQKISGSIHVRMAHDKEEIMTLDGQTVQVNPDILMIADEKNALAIAGVMGGLDSGVTVNTTDIFLESAYFTADKIAPAVRRYKLSSDSSYRFERGIDPTLQTLAIERATELLLSLVGGQPGPIIETKHEVELPKAKSIELRYARIQRVLGFEIPESIVEQLLNKLDFAITKTTDGWQVQVPLRRPDITLEVDLIEEVIRLYGYDKLPSRGTDAMLCMNPRAETQLESNLLTKTLCDLGYHEVITYSFIDKALQRLLDPHREPKELKNPITSEMSVMRTSLWPSLLTTYLYNIHRQQQRVRIFEQGLTFLSQPGIAKQERVLSGLASGPLLDEQWGAPARDVDFFDIKGDLEHLLKLTKDEQNFIFKPATHPGLHPGQSADIYRNDEYVGTFGAIHPEIAQSLDINQKVFVFELMIDALQKAVMPHYEEISKFPEIRRDLAILVDQTVPVQQIQDTIVNVGGKLLKNVTLFDVYQGKGVTPHRKSIALALTLQHESRTLVDEEVNEVFGRIVEILTQEFAAELRG